MNPNDSFYPDYLASYYPSFENTQNPQDFSYESNMNTQFPPNLAQNTPDSTPDCVEITPNTAVSWEPIEDVALMSAFVFVSGDATKGTNRKGETYGIQFPRCMSTLVWKILVNSQSDPWIH